MHDKFAASYEPSPGRGVRTEAVFDIEDAGACPWPGRRSREDIELFPAETGMPSAAGGGNIDPILGTPGIGLIRP